ncbi:MAG TPA: hemerythrin domain-containing protein [Ornithinibacter sp.]|nr:hemerythrin domain-containing protein [Ornithinibacter sp.]
MSTTPTHHPQIRLPGQSHVAEGPHDHSGMYVMHFALRRDLDNFVSAVRQTPVGDADTWEAMRDRWTFFAEVLHHHHAVEDSTYWPTVERRARERGTPEDVAVLTAMTDEHEDIDPAVHRVTEGFAAVLDHPCEEHRNALDIRVTSLRELLHEHLAHEEREALPVVQRVLTPQEFADVDAAVQRAYPARLVLRVLPWALHGIPRDGGESLLESDGMAFRVLHRLTRGRFERGERRAFRYSASVGAVG